MSAIFTPVNQIKLTNVAVVRHKRKGKRFEIACYPNKVSAWREGIEKDIDEVLQIETIFLNVSKGVSANEEVLQEAYGTTDVSKICKLILQKGELQVSSKERAAQTHALIKDIATVISEKCIDSETKRPITVTAVEQAMKDIHFGVNLSKSAKQQAVAAIPKLQEVLPIERAEMRIRAICGKKTDAKKARAVLEPLFSAIEDVSYRPEVIFVGRVEPGAFRKVEDAVKGLSKSKLLWRL
eukprot:TRINITY_DN36468_c0_g1_i1.p1 TRINITY_DN36468_c0_g1~~TRINITY_DN36468_c0_g1_i1.p1  ORF type:complete len:239 (+),score=45.51 TRINITY_DN36468_c0_g1_i1:106-822(+)